MSSILSADPNTLLAHEHAIMHGDIGEMPSDFAGLISEMTRDWDDEDLDAQMQSLQQ